MWTPALGLERIETVGAPLELAREVKERPKSEIKDWKRDGLVESRLIASTYDSEETCAAGDMASKTIAI
jgi:hypothetical protein